MIPPDLRIAFDEARDEARGNRALLQACRKPHEFRYVEGEMTAVCARCGGRLAVDKAVWYLRGLEDSTPR